ncbi:TetR family transcriptional regulator [Leucobacter komagatae]|uniref:L-aspartate dehydrogenase n=1 Tax=Leucobacter komagatae TaxID=55969 RepID=A0A542XXY1_9MICO|nr:aspartate dehydrogenase domain-containing protein [Leucobacter komagatae]TQL40695.1 TetR family transcriptional regulator [Leucobacter komagatae]
MASVSRGRPPASSRETLADAASELFLEQGYDTTTVADITTRAGVSRSSFFNYFDGKAATIWYALDEHLAEFAAAGPSGEGVGSAKALAGRVGAAPPHTLALAIANADAMGVREELGTGRALRQASLAVALAAGARSPGKASLAAQIVAAARSAAVFAGIWQWAERGAGTTDLEAEILTALRSIELGAPVSRDALRVAVVGSGAIGARVIEELAAGNVPGAELAGVVTRRADALTEAVGELSAGITDFGDDLDAAIRESDLVVECAGISAAQSIGAQVVSAGRDLLIVSIGALANTESRRALTSGPGVLRLATGAIGGLDLLAAAARPGGIEGGITSASLTSTKGAASLVQPWMSAEQVRRLETATEPFTLFEGAVAEAVELYPGSLNVACALAHATGLWRETLVRLVADPQAERTTHEIAAAGAAGEYRFVMTNAVSEANPTSSAVVAETVLRGIGVLAGPGATFV